MAETPLWCRVVRYYVSTAGGTVAIEVRETVSGQPGRYRVTLDDGEHDVEVRGSHGLVDGHVVPCALDERTERAHFREGSLPCTVTTIDPAVTAASGAAHRPELRAPMPGKVVEVRIAEGTAVEAGQCLVVIEAMKMQNELTAPCAGRVRRLHVSPGRPVEAGALLLELEDLSDGA